MEAQLKELLPFLHDRNPQARQLALSHLLGHTPSGTPYRDIFFSGLGGGLKGTDVIRDLKHLCLDQPAIAHDAFRALINLSDSPLLVPQLSEVPFMAFLVSYIIHPPSLLADLASMILSNLTTHSTPCNILLSLKIPIIPQPSSDPAFYPTRSRSGTSPPPEPLPTVDQIEVLGLPLLVEAFAQAARVKGTTNLRSRKGELDFLASVFANISVTSLGRMFFMTPYPATSFPPSKAYEFLLSKLAVFTEHPDIIRRGGVVSLIKNCTFEPSMHKALLSPETEIFSGSSDKAAPGVDILQYILLPLAGSDEYEPEVQELLPPALQLLPPTKKREPDPALRLRHIETLLLLCTTRWGRDFLRQNGTYDVVRTVHESETEDSISEHIERLVVLLKGDELAREETLIQARDDDKIVEI